MPERPAEVVPAAPVEEDEWNWQGTYALEPGGSDEADRPAPAQGIGWPDELEEFERAARKAEQPEPELEREPATVAAGVPAATEYELGAEPVVPPPACRDGAVADAPAAAAGPSPASAPAPAPAPAPAEATAEPWWPPRLLYAARGPEGVSVTLGVGLALWVFVTLVPEYCLAILADADLLGTPSMGRLVALVSGLPALVLTPLVLIYWLQYLGRVLAASAEGERLPPRPPDRNADGVLNGLGTWVVWLVLGLGPGLLPLGAYLVVGQAEGSWGLAAPGVLGLLGLPYALVALLLGFLHDDALAATPTRVLGSMARLGPSVFGLSLTAAATLGLGPLAFAAALALRGRHFGVYVLASLPCWLTVVASTFTAMHTLGAYYAPRRRRLKWRRVRRRWGAR